MATASETRASINSALIQIEMRLSTNPGGAELDALRTAYTALWLELAKADDELLGAAADRVTLAARRLEQIIRSSGSMTPGAYLSALSSTAAAIAGGMPLVEQGSSPISNGTTGATQDGADTMQTGTRTMQGGTGHVQGGSTQTIPTDSGGWADLVAAYRGYAGVTDSLKTASLAQWIVESGRGGSDLAQLHLNFGGIKFRDRMVGHANPVDYTGTDGESTVYCKFNSVSAYISGYWHFIASGPYGGWESFQSDGAAYLRHIAPRYAGDPAYVTKVLGVFDEARKLLGLTSPEVVTEAGVGAGIGTGTGLTPVAVIIGHNRNDKGHSGRSPIDAAEYDWNTEVANAMVSEAGHYNLKVAIFRRQAGLGYSEEIRRVYGEVAAYRPACALELHYNGVEDTTAHGIEMLCRPDNGRAKALGLVLANEVHELLNLRKRREDGLFLVTSGDRGAGSCYALPEVPTVLCEPFFVTNANDRSAMAAIGQAGLARAYLRAIRAWAATA